MNLISRNQYLNQLIDLQKKNIIKVITGIRRCGKSTIFQLFIDYLLNEGVDKNDIYSYNFEDFTLQPYIDDPRKLHEELIEVAKTGRQIYVFLDEIQNIRNFERIIDSLHLRPNIDVYITGSNAFLLSGELATLLTGRYIEIHVLPFSFKEYADVKNNSTFSDSLLNDYINEGGLPGTFALPEQLRKNYIKDIYNSILQKDIMHRNKWRKADHFDRLVRFMFDNVGSKLSANKIANTFKTMGFQISCHTVESYLDAIRESYLFYKVPRYNIKGRTILSTQEKYYTADLGLKAAILGQSAHTDIGHSLENIVFLELLRRNYTIFTGKSDENEIDFVVQTHSGEMQYIQVAYTAKEESTLKRELTPLQKIKDNYRKILLTTDEFEFNNEGIEQLNVKKWLMGE